MASALLLLLCVIPIAIYKLRHVIWGKSVGFYLSTSLRMPHNARIVVDKEDYSGQYSNEGETLLVFDVTAQQTAAYLALSEATPGPLPGPLPCSSP